MPTMYRIFAAALAAVALSSSISSAYAQDLAVRPSSATLVGVTSYGQLDGALVTAIAMPDALNADDVATWNGRGGLREVLTVTKEEPLCPPAKPDMASCMGIALRTYQIRVSGMTAVNQKDRAPLQGSIEVGDRVNAYGLFDGSSMDAEIVRDLDKPLSAQPIQLDNLRVVGVTQGKDGIQVEVVRGTGACWSYLSAARLAYPCPAGSEPAANVRASAEAQSMQVAAYYSIAVPRTASVMDAARAPIAASSIAVGDTINAYGTLASRGMMTAQIVRVTSKGMASGKLKIGVAAGSALLTQGRDMSRIEMTVTGGAAPYRWRAIGLPEGVQLSAPSVIACITAPCPQPANDSAYLYGTPTQAGSFQAVVVVTDAQGTESVLTIPLQVAQSSAFSVSVRTDKSSYRANEAVGIDVTLANISTKVQKATMSNGCQADYDVLPGFSLRAVQVCTLALGTVTLQPGESKTYHFDHDLSAHPLTKMAFPQTLDVIGRVQNVGEASTKITVNAAR